jgi:phenylalanyl-tRNA synthetase beta chain
VDFATIAKASDRATDLILTAAGGKVVARRDACLREKTGARSAIAVTQADVKKLLGTTVEIARAQKILTRLGCAVAAAGDGITAVPPENRNDLKIKEDIIEEIARVIGFDNLPMSLPSVGAINITVDLESEGFNQRVADNFIAQGFHEVLTYAMISRPALEKAGYDGVEPIAMQNPMSAEQELMRPTALPNMLQAVAFNINRGQKDLKFFEVGKRYLPGGERWTLTAVVTGRDEGDWRKGKRAAVDFFDLKGAVVMALEKERVHGLLFKAGTGAAFEPGQTAQIILDDTTIGTIGCIREDVLAQFEIKKTRVHFVELDLESTQEAVTPRARFAPLDEYPAVVRDVSLAVKDATWEDLRAVCLAGGQGLLRKVELVEEYRGAKIEAGWRGIVISLTYQAKDKTLTDDVINPLHENIVAQLIARFNAKRR